MKALPPWATSLGTLLGMWLVGQKRSVGWIVGLVNQVVRVTFAVVFEAWGLLPLTLALIVIYTRALVAWRSEEAIASEIASAVGPLAPEWRHCPRCGTGGPTDDKGQIVAHPCDRLLIENVAYANGQRPAPGVWHTS